MRLSPLLLGGCALVLAACATPRERCISDATRELRTIDALITETRGNIDRGYAIIREPDTRTRLVYCYNPPDEPFSFCPVAEPTVRERPVAIDRAEERRKLASLNERRAELLPRARAELAACEARYPER